MALIELTTNLKSLTNKQTGAKSLLVSKDINDPPKTGGIAVQANARIDDLVRHTKLLTRKPGLKFLGNQALLAQTDMKKFVKGQQGKSIKAIAKAVGKKALDTLENTALATASILAQIPVNGTGTHFVRGFKKANGTYLDLHGMKLSSFNAPDGSIIPNNPANGDEDGGSFIVPDEFSITKLGATNRNKYNAGQEWQQQFGNFIPKQTKDYIDSEGSEPRKIVKAGNKAFVDNTGDQGWNPTHESEIKNKESESPTITVNKVGKPSKSYKQRPDEIEDDATYIQGKASNQVAGGEKAFVDNIGDQGWTGPLSGSILKEKETTGEIVVNKVGEASRTFKQRPDAIEGESTYLKDTQSLVAAAGNKIAALQNAGVSPGVDPISGSSIHVDPKFSEGQNSTTFTVKTRSTEAREYKQRPDVGHADSSQQNIHDINIDGTEVTYLDQITTVGNKSDDESRQARIDRSAIAPGAKPDPVQSLAKQTSSILGSDQEDIIPFEFNTFYPGNTAGNFLYFRAFLGSFSDNFTGDWAGTKYVGRAEEFFNYTGFSRTFSFAFKAAAFSKKQLYPIYRKLNHLVGGTAPTYGKDGLFMRGTLLKLTIGDYLINQNGFLTSVNLTWNNDYPWEIEGDLRVPHLLDVACEFTPIHTFNPELSLIHI